MPKRSEKANTSPHFIVSCEHGGNKIPAPYRHFFLGWDTALQSHMGYDAGALSLAKQLAKALQAPLFFSTVSRLLVDLNRSVGHAKFYSKAIPPDKKALRADILEHYYFPYRIALEEEIKKAIRAGQVVVHISSHSFTHRLHGQYRKADVGLLYDPARQAEARLCRRWKVVLEHLTPELIIRRNYPYRGSSDGLTTYFRRCFPPRDYLGVELEINQKHVTLRSKSWQNFQGILVESAQQVLCDGKYYIT